jgi:predicted nucleic acid-binding protein
MRHLVDNDVFFAALYQGHVGHLSARRRLNAIKSAGWGIAAETYLAAIRLLMNPAIMGGGVLTAAEALDAVDLELAGEYPGRVVLAQQAPARAFLAGARGHRQVMDFWLVQIAREQGARLLTNDAGTLAHWPKDTAAILR